MDEKYFVPDILIRAQIFGVGMFCGNFLFICYASAL